MARASKLTKARTARIIKAVRIGANKDRAAQCAGVGKSTMYDWLQRGDRDLKENKKTLAAQFRLDYEKAEAEAETRMLEVIDEAATRKDGPDWKAAAWKLERKWPARYARRQVLSLNRDDGIMSSTMADLNNLSTEELRQYRELVTKAAKRTKEIPKEGLH